MKMNMRTLSYYICSKNVREITESTFEYQFGENEALEENESRTDVFDSCSDEEPPTMADKIDNSAFFIVGRTCRFRKTIKLS